VKIVDIRLLDFSLTPRITTSPPAGLSLGRPVTIVTAISDKGGIGLGEIAPLKGFSTEDLVGARSQALRVAAHLVGTELPRDFPSLKTWINGLADEFPDLPPSAIFGLETSMADLASRAAGLPLSVWLNRDAAASVPVNAIISSRGGMLAEEIRGKLEMGYRTFKLKVGRGSRTEDMNRTAAVRDIAGEGASIRLDANRSWQFDQAVANLRELGRCGIEYVEEPLHEGSLCRLSDLHEETGVETALDESLRSADMNEIESLIRTPGVGAVIIKPSSAGGLARALEIARIARDNGRKPVISSMFESGVGVAACLHVAAALGTPIPPCGLSTLEFLSDTLIREELPVLDGRMEIPGVPGLGITLKEDSLPW
jgi:o-succinylbenzoate synthase